MYAALDASNGLRHIIKHFVGIQFKLTYIIIYTFQFIPTIIHFDASKQIVTNLEEMIVKRNHIPLICVRELGFDVEEDWKRSKMVEEIVFVLQAAG